MIIRERAEHFVMIEQHEHAHFSGQLFNQLRSRPAPAKGYWNSIKYAIFNHDSGWIPFDKTPFWNDEQNSPYSFTNFPITPKIVLYEYGINTVQANDPYAALLCSEHYTRFLHNNSASEAVEFIRKEQERRERIKKELQLFDEELFVLHYEFLQFFDNLSLYVCLNEPGVNKEQEHSFFKQGIELPSTLDKEKLQLRWESHEDILLNKRLFKPDFTLKLSQKVISKKDISTFGLQKAYRNTQNEKITITFKKASQSD